MSVGTWTMRFGSSMFPSWMGLKRCGNGMTGSPGWGADLDA
jgi:hypothetical protein